MTCWRAIVPLALLAPVFAGCAGGTHAADKSGGAVLGPVVLTMANKDADLAGDPAVADFVRRVAAVSNRHLHIRVISGWGNSAADAEAQVVRGVAAGKADLGWAGSRVFDKLGVSSFRALSAPMLIDSYPLEEAVLRSAVPAQMLLALARLHLVPLGMVGDGLRHPIAVDRPLLSAADWRGLSIGGYASATQELAVRALRARPVVASGILRLHDLQTGQLQGFEFDIRRYAQYDLAAQARFVTANVDLWPQFDVLFANPRRLGRLTGQERAWLDKAAQAAARESVATADRERRWVLKACALGARFADASPADLASLRHAFAPVYRWLDRNPPTRHFIDEIQSLNRRLAIPPSGVSHLPAGCRG